MFEQKLDSVVCSMVSLQSPFGPVDRSSSREASCTRINAASVIKNNRRNTPPSSASNNSSTSFQPDMSDKSQDKIVSERARNRAVEEVRVVVRSHIYPSCKFANNETFFAFQPVRDPEDPLRGCFFRAIRKRCNPVDNDEGAWWVSMAKEAKNTINKKRTSANSALKKEIVGGY